MTLPIGYLLMHAAIRAETTRLDAFAQGLAAGRRHAGSRQLTALRDHLHRVAEAIHLHHVAEDEHVWPLLREYAADAERLAALTDDHGELDPLMESIDRSLGLLVDRPGDREARRALADAARRLHETMTVHLDEEEAVVVPAVQTLVPAERFAQVERAVQGASSMAKTAFALPWVAAADPVLFARLPEASGPMLRLMLALTRGRHAESVLAAYADLAPPPSPIVLCAEAEQVVPAPPEQVYAAVADVGLMAGFSPECLRCEWEEGTPGPVPGARFRGWNNDRGMRWARECVVTVAEPGREFAYRTMPAGRFRDSTVWRFRLERVPEGTLVRQSFELTAGPFVQWLERVSRRDRRTPRGMRETLRRLAESFADPAGAPGPEPDRAAATGRTTRD